MFFKFIFPLFFLVTAVAAEKNEMGDCRDRGIPPYQKLKHQSIPMPRPAPGKPLVVKISAEIMTVTIHEEEEEFEATLFFRQEWKDCRLAFASKEKGEFRLVKDPASIWTPDLFFVDNIMNETNNGSYIKHYPDGRVFTAEKKTVRTSCALNVSSYPFDNQTCRLQIESYGHTIDDIIVQWNEPAVTRRVLTHEFVATAETELGCAKFRDAEYSSARIIFSVTRAPIEIIFGVLLPLAVIAVCSWTSFLVTREENGVRLTLCVSPIMTYILQINFCTAFFISPLYLTGLDVWAGTSFAAMFISGLECLYVMYKKGPEYFCSERGNTKDYKERIALGLFLASLNVLSIISVYITRLI